MKELSKNLKNNLSKMEGLTLIGFLVKLNNVFFKSEIKTKMMKLITDYELLNTILDKVQDFFINNDTTSFNILNNEITYDQIFLLSELYMNKYVYKKSNPQLAEYLMISYQTLVTKLKKFISIGLIKKDENDKHIYHFPGEVVHIIDNFIHTRIINYYEIMQFANDKEKEIIFKVFKSMENYSLSKLNKEKTYT